MGNVEGCCGRDAKTTDAPDINDVCESPFVPPEVGVRRNELYHGLDDAGLGIRAPSPLVDTTCKNGAVASTVVAAGPADGCKQEGTSRRRRCTGRHSVCRHGFSRVRTESEEFVHQTLRQMKQRHRCTSEGNNAAVETPSVFAERSTILQDTPSQQCETPKEQSFASRTNSPTAKESRSFAESVAGVSEASSPTTRRESNVVCGTRCAPESVNLVSADQRAITASLDEDGYQVVVMWMDPKAMEKFILRLIDKGGGLVLDERALESFAKLTVDGCGQASFDKLMIELRNAQWLANYCAPPPRERKPSVTDWYEEADDVVDGDATRGSTFSRAKLTLSGLVLSGHDSPIMGNPRTEIIGLSVSS